MVLKNDFGDPDKIVLAGMSQPMNHMTIAGLIDSELSSTATRVARR
jgi:hypothetical protein